MNSTLMRDSLPGLHDAGAGNAAVRGSDDKRSQRLSALEITKTDVHNQVALFARPPESASERGSPGERPPADSIPAGSSGPTGRVFPRRRLPGLEAATVARPPSRSSAMSASAASPPLRLTSFSHGGGCGCKIAPGVLSEILKSSAPGFLPPQLMVGIETADDAAVWKLNDQQALIATTDFFMPIVDDPFDFGRIAATNAISDVYAMGGTPIMALAIVAMPIAQLPVDVIARVLAGGNAVCQDAGIPIAGGHTIDSVEPIYGLVVMGLVHPDRVRRNADARTGDVLVLGKPLGVGVLSAALKKGALDAAGYARLIATTTRLNKPGPRLAELPGVHAITDVTGFGLAGHALEMARGAGLRARIDWRAVPLIAGVDGLASAGFITGASGRNWAGYGADVRLDPALPPLARDLLSDPQTSGGLLVSCSPDSVDAVLACFAEGGFGDAAVIGRMAAGAPGLDVLA
jgi:selenide,water dikinase